MLRTRKHLIFGHFPLMAEQLSCMALFASYYPKSVKINIRKETTIMKLQVGQEAPDFKLPSHMDKDIRLSDYRGKNVVLAFFPLAWTPI